VRGAVVLGLTNPLKAEEVRIRFEGVLRHK
jgi:hypothetical protein